jgi:ATP-dependent protease ClpP protease subunit
MYILPINGVIGEDFKLTDLLMHLNAAKNESVIKLIIASPGGFTDIANQMREVLEASGKLIYSTNSGDVASAAVELFLTAPKENRTFNPEKGIFLIHMPFIDPIDGGVTGTAEEIQQVADEMRLLEKDIVKYYSKKTNVSSNILEGFMKENIPLTTEQVESLGFATIIKPVFKAVAYYKSNKNEMDNKEVIEKMTGIEKLLGKVMSFIKPKNLMVQDTNGAQIDFGPDIQDPSQIVVGIPATVDGNPAEGEYVLPDGSTLVFAAGSLAEIKPTQGDTAEALKRENEQLKAELAAKSQEFDSFKQSAENQIKEITTQFKAFRNQFSSGDDGHRNIPSGNNDEPKVRNAFKKVTT